MSVGIAAREQRKKKEGRGFALGAQKESLRVKKRGKKEKKRKRVLHAGDTERNRWGCSTRTREKIKGWGFTRLRHTTKWLGLKRENRRKKDGKRCT